MGDPDDVTITIIQVHLLQSAALNLYSDETQLCLAFNPSNSDDEMTDRVKTILWDCA